MANFSPDLGSGTVFLMARADLADQFGVPQTITSLTASVRYVVDSIKFGKDYEADKAACDAVWRHLVQFQPIPIWKTLPDPTPGPWVDAIQWLAALREEVRQLAQERPATAKTVALLFSSQFGVSASLLGDDDLYLEDEK